MSRFRLALPVAAVFSLSATVGLARETTQCVANDNGRYECSIENIRAHQSATAELGKCRDPDHFMMFGTQSLEPDQERTRGRQTVRLRVESDDDPPRVYKLDVQIGRHRLIARNTGMRTVSQLNYDVRC